MKNIHPLSALHHVRFREILLYKYKRATSYSRLSITWIRTENVYPFELKRVITEENFTEGIEKSVPVKEVSSREVQIMESNYRGKP